MRLGSVCVGLALLALPLQAGEMHDVLRSYVEVWNTGEVEELSELVTEDFKRLGGFGPASSREELAQVIRGSRGFYRDLRIELQQVVANPDRGAMRWRFTGGWGKTRFTVDSVNFAMYRFRDGKISEERIHGNYMDLFRTFEYRLLPPQVEIVPPPVETPPGPGLSERMQGMAARLHERAAAPLLESSKSMGQITLQTDTGCILVVDDEPLGWLQADSEIQLTLPRGEHFIAARSAGGSTFFQETIKVKKGRNQIVHIKGPGRVIVRPRQRITEDLETGLMWQMTDGGKDATLDAARAQCEALEQGGFSDWRLPTIHELVSLHDAESSKRYRSISGVTLTDCCPWSSTPHGDYTWTYAFSMDMRYLQYETLGFHMRVLCVRDAAPS